MAFGHAADVSGGHRAVAQRFGFANGCAEQGMIGCVAKVVADGLQIRSKQDLKIMSHRNFS